MTKIGNNIKKIRKTKGLSQQAFADLFGLTRGNISSYEEHRAEPKLDSITKIANYFCIPLDNFINQTLTVNEILQFNGDRLMEQEHHLFDLQLKEVPFINDNLYVKCSHREMAYNDWESFPKLVLPETSNNNLFALAFHSNIPHHEELPDYSMHDVLVFEEVTEQNIHLCQQKTGLFINEQEVIIGKYEIKNTNISLILNDFKKIPFHFRQDRQFWKLFAVYQHKI